MESNVFKNFVLILGFPFRLTQIISVTYICFLLLLKIPSAFILVITRDIQLIFFCLTASNKNFLVTNSITPMVHLSNIVIGKPLKNFTIN